MPLTLAKPVFGSASLVHRLLFHKSKGPQEQEIFPDDQPKFPLPSPTMDKRGCLRLDFDIQSKIHISNKLFIFTRKGYEQRLHHKLFITAHCRYLSSQTAGQVDLLQIVPLQPVTFPWQFLPAFYPEAKWLEHWKVLVKLGVCSWLWSLGDVISAPCTSVSCL